MGFIGATQICGQSPTLVLVDADGRPIRIVRAIMESVAFSVRHVLAVAEQQLGLRRSAFAARR
jgi:sugar (pentulose or hexulose) kinase